MAATLALALIGDLVGSKKIPAARRSEVQIQLNEAFDAMMVDGGSGLLSRPTITLGDEFQILFCADAAGGQAVVEALSTIVATVRPERVRFGLGVGALTTPLQAESLGMDGPCFHRARAALESAREEGVPCRLQTGDQAEDDLWGALASLCLRDRFAWSEAQWEVIEAYGRLGAWSAAAKELGITRGAATHRHQAAGWSLHRTAWESLGAAMGSRLKHKRTA